MNRSENVIIDVFEDITSLTKAEVFQQAELVDSRQQVRDAYTSLVAKGVLAEDDHGVVTLYRARAIEYDRLHPLLEPADEDF